MRKLSAALAIVFVASAVSLAGGSVSANINAPIKLKKVTAGLDNPVALAWRGNDGGTIYVAEQTGSIVIVKDGNILGTVLEAQRHLGGRRAGLARHRVLEQRQEALRRLHRRERRHPHRRVHDERRRSPTRRRGDRC